MNVSTSHRPRAVGIAVSIAVGTVLGGCSDDPLADTASRPATDATAAEPAGDDPANSTTDPQAVSTTAPEPVPTTSVDDVAAATTTIPATDTLFDGGPVELPRDIRFGYLTVSVQAVETDDRTTSVAVELLNPTDADLSGLRPELFRLVDTGGEFVDLDLPEGGNIDVAAGGVSRITLTGDPIDPERAALVVDDRRSAPAILPFGGPQLASGFPVDVAPPELGPVELNCSGGDTATIEVAATATTLTLDRDRPTGILSFGLGRADSDEVYVRLDLELTQIDPCDLTVRLLGFEVTSGDFDVSVAQPDLALATAAPLPVWITVPLGTDRIELVLADNPPFAIEIAS